jgi:two-component system cell cycle sensor histidine kinase/response regulator CckA
VQLEVSDNGVGMTPETLRKIFDPFFTTKVTGRGLGLSAVIGIVKGHHGGLRVESDPGHRTTFKIAFPVG